MNPIENINPLYRNPFGMAFQWKRCPAAEALKVHLVFRDMGLSLSFDELSKFSGCIGKALHNASYCKGCPNHGECRTHLLETPLKQLSFVMNHQELTALKELVDGTIFQLGLNKLLKGL
ncbi:MAG: hypothetical protein AB3N16_12450 [Flavobacteriaceae bacterium]